MSRFEEYRGRFRHARLEREDGVLTLTLHTDGGPIVWGKGPHDELGHCFAGIAADPENEIVIVTGTGDEFIGAMDMPPIDRVPARAYEHLYADALRLLDALLDIRVPVIGVVNGPAVVHAEIAVLSDLVIAAEHAVFQDAPHFPSGLVPGDGVHVVWPMLLGPNRARYFLLTGQTLTAAEALSLGVVSEVLPRERLLPRARELARLLLRQPPLTRRYARALLTRDLRRRLHDELALGLALEGLAWSEYSPNGKSIRA